MSTFDALFVPAELRAAVTDTAWIAAMLRFEGALATVEAELGVIPAEAGTVIAAACERAEIDAEALGEEGRSVANPAEPLVRALRKQLPQAAAGYVHFGATSQDVMDTAAMLVGRRALELILAELEGVATSCAELGETHRATPMAARTLMQQAVPTTFGLKAAGWLVAVLDARRGLVGAREELAVELGGAGGTLAALGERGPAVLQRLAAELDLAEPTLPWHTSRVRLAALGGALEVAAGVLEKIALDLVLMAQTEVAEVVESGAAGGSSTMPQKRNPVRSILARACASRVHGHASVLARALAQEHERAAGAWQAEWDSLSGALALTGGCAAALRSALDGLEVDAARMRANLDLTGGAIMAERVSFVLSSRIGRHEAHSLLAEVTSSTRVSGRTFREELLTDPRVGLDAGEVDALLDPATYLGAADVFVDRALERYREEGL